MTAPSTDRVAEIADACCMDIDQPKADDEHIKHYMEYAIRAALSDPLLLSAVRAEERERCAKVCEEYAKSLDVEYNRKHFILKDLQEPYLEAAAQIRSLGDKFSDDGSIRQMTSPASARDKRVAELLPCPFCGKPAEHVREGDHHGEFFKLGCPDANCCAHWTFYTELIENEAESIAAWNRRADLTAAIREAALREAAKAAIEAVADCEGTIASQNFVAAAILALED